MSRRGRANTLPGRYEGLEFSFAHMEEEVKNMRATAKAFLDSDGVSYELVIQNWLQALISIRDSACDRPFTWQIPEDSPIKTKVSEGSYEARRPHRGRPVVGTLCANWEIRASAERPRQTFRLVGLASTKVQILGVEGSEGLRPLVKWQFEVGDHQSPGCHFHVGIASALPVPRLPTMLVTPMDALDFLLGELFQTEWRQKVAQESDAVNIWARHQKTRLTNLLHWQTEQLEHSEGSPWVFLKHSKPRRDVLMGRARR